MPVTSRSSSNVSPDRTEPSLHLFPRQHRERFLKRRRSPVLPAFSKEQNVLDIVLDDSSGLVGLPIEARAVPFGFHGTVRDLVPKNRLEAIEAELPGADLDIGVERYQIVAPAAFSRNTNIADHAANSS